MAKELRTILRQPKVYNPPKDKVPFRLPKIILVLAILLIIFLGLIYLIFLSPLFNIRNIIAEGSPPTEIISKLDELKGSNLFLINSQKIQNEFALGNPEIVSLKIYRGIPSTLKLKYTCRSGEIIWQSNGKNYLVDGEGIAFKEISQATELPLVIDNKNLEVKIPMTVASANFVAFIKDAPPKLIDKGLKIKHFEVNETTFQVDAVTSKKIKIIFDTIRPLSEQIEALSKVWPENESEIKEYIDTRVEGWVYYK